MSTDDVREAVRARYAAAATTAACCGTVPSDLELDADGAAVFGGALYEGEEAAEPALAASLGCGVPTAVADLHPGEVVLDLGSGAGGDVLISARRVGPTGRAIGLDMTEEMLTLARANAEAAGVANVEFLHGYLEDVPLPDDSVDVAISNCVLNLAADKSVVLAEVARVLRPGGRLAFSDVVADDDMDAATAADMAAWTGCVAGALTLPQMTGALAAAGFVDAEVRPTHRVHEHAQAAIIRASLPASGSTTVAPTARTLEVFDPAMCCSTGVCGPGVDPDLARFESDLRWVEEHGVTVTRYNLAQQPGEFVGRPLVAAILQSGGEDALPVVLVDGALRSSGTRPTRAELAATLSLRHPADDAPAADAATGCCAPTGDTGAPTTEGCC